MEGRLMEVRLYSSSQLSACVVWTTDTPSKGPEINKPQGGGAFIMGIFGCQGKIK